MGEPSALSHAVPRFSLKVQRLFLYKPWEGGDLLPCEVGKELGLEVLGNRMCRRHRSPEREHWQGVVGQKLAGVGWLDREGGAGAIVKVGRTQDWE